MTINHLNIFYSEGDARRFHHALRLVKRILHPNMLSFCCTAFAEILERLDKNKRKPLPCACLMWCQRLLVEVQKAYRAYRDLQGLIAAQIPIEHKNM